MPGPGDLTQRLLWLGATQPLCAGVEESGTSAEMGGTAPELSRPGQSLPPAPAGIWMFPQAGSPTVAACRDRLCEMPGLQSHHQLPTQLPSCTEPSATKVLFRPAKSSLGERYYLHSQQQRAGSICPSLRTCAPEKWWAMPFLSASTHP